MPVSRPARSRSRRAAAPPVPPDARRQMPLDAASRAMPESSNRYVTVNGKSARFLSSWAGEGQHLLLRWQHAGVRTQVAQSRHPTLAYHPVGVFAYYAEHSDDTSGVVAQRAVRERVVGLLRVSGPLQEQQQGGIPGGLFGGEHPVDAGADVLPYLRPHFEPAGRTPTDICGPRCRDGRRRCRRTSAPVPMPSTWRIATTAGCLPRFAGSGPPVRRSQWGRSPIHLRQIGGEFRVRLENCGTSRAARQALSIVNGHLNTLRSRHPCCKASVMMCWRSPGIRRSSRPRPLRPSARARCDPETAAIRRIRTRGMGNLTMALRA